MAMSCATFSPEAIAMPADEPRQVVLCDEQGHPRGTTGLLAAHAGEGQLHLAFSVYIFSIDRRSLLIQQRSREKLLWPLVWANTCCSHPRPGEETLAASHRRLHEELGFDSSLARGPEFVYRAVDPGHRGVEHEYDVILYGTYS